MAKKPLQKNGYWSRISDEILDDLAVPDAAIRIIAAIDSLGKKDGICFAKNLYFAERFGKSTETISRLITILVNKGYVSRIIDKESGNIRFLSLLPIETLEIIAKSRFEGYTPIDKNINRGIDKNDKSYSQKSPVPIDKNVNSSISIKEKKERGGESPPLLSEKDEINKLENIASKDGLTKEEKSRFSYLNSKAEQSILPDAFYEFFVTEVLGRFDKYTITPAILVDWYRQVFKKYGVDIATIAVSDHRAQIQGWQPTISKVIKIASKIVDAKNKEVAAKKTIEKKGADKIAQEQASTRIKLSERSDQYIQDKLLEARIADNSFDIIHYSREINRRNQLKVTK